MHLYHFIYIIVTPTHTKCYLSDTLKYFTNFKIESHFQCTQNISIFFVEVEVGFVSYFGDMVITANNNGECHEVRCQQQIYFDVY